MAAKAYSTIGTILKFGTAADTLTQLTKIKSYPDLGGSPEQIETTDLEDGQQTFVPGVKQLDTMEFTANYTPEAYAAVVAASNKEGTYELSFGDNGAQGIFTWTGQHTVAVSGGEVNAVREMTITVTASSEITLKAQAGG